MTEFYRLSAEVQQKTHSAAPASEWVSHRAKKGHQLSNGLRVTQKVQNSDPRRFSHFEAEAAVVASKLLNACYRYVLGLAGRGIRPAAKLELRIALGEVAFAALGAFGKSVHEFLHNEGNHPGRWRTGGIVVNIGRIATKNPLSAERRVGL